MLFNFPGAAQALFTIDREVMRMNCEQLLTTPPALHGPEGAETNGWRLDDAGPRFLDGHAGWRRLAALSNSVAFIKDRNDAHHAEWVNQPFVYEQSAAAEFCPRS